MLPSRSCAQAVVGVLFALMGTELVVALVALALGCAGFVAGLLALRGRPVNPDQPDVDDLALEVAKLRKQVRRDRMSAVRAGPGDAEGDIAQPPPELRDVASTSPSAGITKEELRRRVFQGRR